MCFNDEFNGNKKTFCWNIFKKKPYFWQVFPINFLEYCEKLLNLLKFAIDILLMRWLIIIISDFISSAFRGSVNLRGTVIAQSLSSYGHSDGSDEFFIKVYFRIPRSDISFHWLK